MRIFRLLTAIMFLYLLSCSKDEETPTKQAECRHTTIMFFPWSDNLKPCFVQNIRDFQQVIRNNDADGERVIVCIESRIGEADIIEILPTKYDTLYSYADPNFTSSGGISFFLNKIRSLSPSRSYSMIVGSHGTGWIPSNISNLSANTPMKTSAQILAFPETRYFGSVTSTLKIDVTAFSEGIRKSEIPWLDYILFDDCYMANIETAYDLRDVCEFIIASPSEIMSYGFPYLLCGKHLLRADYNAVCNAFLDFYNSYSIPCGTIAVIKCAEIDSLARVMKKANSLSPHLDTVAPLQTMDGYSPPIFFDFRDYVEHLSLPDSVKYEVIGQTNKVVPYKANTDEYYSAYFGKIPINSYSGITTSAPTKSEVANLLTLTNWHKASDFSSP